MNPTSTIINQIISGTEILGKPSNLSPPMGRAVTLQLEYFLLLPSSCLSAPSDGSDLDPPPSQGLVSELFSSLLHFIAPCSSSVLEKRTKVHSLAPKAPLARRSAALAGQGQFVTAVATVPSKNREGKHSGRDEQKSH